MVIAVDRTLWLANARRIRSATPATDGSFTVPGLPAGEYAIAVVEDLDEVDLTDPAFLAQIVSAGLKVTLADGEKKRQDLRAGG